jgi:hypothetical protein
MHADGYGGYKKLYGNQIVEAACMAHVRRKFHDVIKLKPSPIADEALSRIGALYDIEDRIRGMPADQRRTLRQQHARPILDELKVWIEDDAFDVAAEAETGRGDAICPVAMGSLERLHRRWPCRNRQQYS